MCNAREDTKDKQNRSGNERMRGRGGASAFTLEGTCLIRFMMG